MICCKGQTRIGLGVGWGYSKVLTGQIESPQKMFGVLTAK